MTPPLVFISYSHKDEKEKDTLLTHLVALQGAGLIQSWSDDKIGAGAKWEQEIYRVIAEARIAILLITANFLSSDFILNEEVPRILERHRSGKLAIIPVIAKPCPWKAFKWLAEVQVRPKNARPVWGEGGSHVDEDLAAIAEEVIELVSVGVQPHVTEQEKKLQEEQRAAALRDIDELGLLLESNLSRSVRRYLEYKRRRDQGWAFPEVQERLETKWKDIAPPQLQQTVELVQVSEQELRARIEGIGVEQVVNALKWSLTRLNDKDWQQRILDLLPVLQEWPSHRHHIDELFDVIERKPMEAMLLRTWSELVLQSSYRPWLGTDIEQGLQVLGLPGSPFGPGKAEEDVLLMPCRVNLSVTTQLRKPRSALVIGPSGSGKTAIALLLVQDSLRELEAFPVYWRLPAMTLPLVQLEDIARIIARMLLSYIAAKPAAFLNHEIEGKAALAHLLGRYIGTGADLTLHFYQAGLPKVGAGREVLTEIEVLLQDVSFDEPLDKSELPGLLAGSRPQGFFYTMLLLDVQAGVGKEGTSFPKTDLASFFELVTTLERRGIFVKAFIPTEVFEIWSEKEIPVEKFELTWLPRELKELLINRLTHPDFRYDTLAAWCVPGQGNLRPDERLVECANGSPARLLALGNALLGCIGRKGDKLTAQDLQAVLDLSS